MRRIFFRESKNLGETAFPAAAITILERVDDADTWENQVKHVAQFTDPDYLESYEGSVGAAVMGELPRRARRILDFGCWSGITTAYLADLTGCRVVGIDIDQPSIDFARRFIGTGRTIFDVCSPEIIPLKTGSVDLIAINQVFCNMFRPHYEPMISELARVLRRGGKLVLNESNNPGSPELQARLKELYARLESENGAYYRARRQVIDQLLPESAPNDSHARATCYKTREEVETYVRAHETNTNGGEPRYFEPDALIAPVSMQPYGAPSRPTDPSFLSKSMPGIACSARPATSIHRTDKSPPSPAFILSERNRMPQVYRNEPSLAGHDILDVVGKSELHMHRLGTKMRAWRRNRLSHNLNMLDM